MRALASSPRFVRRAVLAFAVALVGCGDAPAPGLTLRALSMEPCTGCRALRDRGFDVYLKPMPFAASADIERVEKTVDSTGMPAIHIRFKPEASGRLLRTTAEHVNEPLAWTVDDAILTVANISEPFGADMIFTGVDAAETDRLYARITGAPSRMGERRRPE